MHLRGIRIIARKVLFDMSGRGQLEMSQEGHVGSRQIDLGANKRSARVARNFVKETLRDWGYEALEPEATLAVSELVTNAVVHGRSGSSVTIVDLGGCSVSLRIRDDAAERPKIIDAGSDATSGRGMMLVDAVANSWGVEDDPPGKVVWLDLTDGTSRQA